jgi:hypothetical protein
MMRAMMRIELNKKRVKGETFMGILLTSVA